MSRLFVGLMRGVSRKGASFSLGRSLAASFPPRLAHCRGSLTHRRPLRDGVDGTGPAAIATTSQFGLRKLARKAMRNFAGSTVKYAREGYRNGGKLKARAEGGGDGKFYARIAVFAELSGP